MAKAIKTNVLRHLDALKIPYETREYTVEDEQFDGLLTAHKLGMDPAMVFKTLVLTGDKLPHLVCCLPVDKELDLKAVARVTGNKRVSMLPQKELLGLTGYLRGGCSPIGMKKAFPTFVDEGALLHERIFVSAGRIGQQVELAPRDLAALTGARFADLLAP